MANFTTKSQIGKKSAKSKRSIFHEFEIVWKLTNTNCRKYRKKFREIISIFFAFLWSVHFASRKLNSRCFWWKYATIWWNFSLDLLLWKYRYEKMMHREAWLKIRWGKSRKVGTRTRRRKFLIQLDDFSSSPRYPHLPYFGIDKVLTWKSLNSSSMTGT